MRQICSRVENRAETEPTSGENAALLMLCVNERIAFSMKRIEACVVILREIIASDPLATILSPGTESDQYY